jgi:hypothetical protein
MRPPADEFAQSKTGIAVIVSEAGAFACQRW